MSATVLEENSRTWVITEKLSERAVCMTETDVKMGRGPSITVGKFLCHLEGHPDLKAFMRIYHQIPIARTEDADLDTLAQQPVPPKTYGDHHHILTVYLLSSFWNTSRLFKPLVIPL
jgi:hypothetical protein